MSTPNAHNLEHVLAQLAERKQQGRGEAEARLKAISEKMTPEWNDEMRRRITQLDRMASSPRSKLPKLYVLMEQVGDLRAPYLACNSGCSACCKTIPVEISDLEAKLISEATGIAYRTLTPGRHSIEGTSPDWKNTPCPFLKDDRCSIYEHRPYNCRSLGVVDKDSLTCTPENTALARANDPRAVPVSMTKMQAFDPSYINLTQRSGAIWADIRQFFPTRPT